MKRKMKVFLSSLALALLIAFANHSQAQQEKSEFAKAITDSLKSQVGLSDEQYPKVLAVNESFVAKSQQIKSEGGSKIAMLKKMRAAGEERKTSLKALLTDEQYKKFEEHQEENKKMIKEHFQNR